MRALPALLCATALTALAGSADAALLYANDFEGPASFGSGVSGSLSNYGLEAASVGAWNAGGWAGSYAVNRGGGNPQAFTTLALSNLAPHSHIDGGFILGFLESWDSLNGGCCSPDHLEVWIDGNQVADMTYNNALGTVKDVDGGTVVAEYVQANGDGYYSDTLVDMSTAPWLSFAHSASTLTIALRASGGGWQGGSDEGWGLDDVRLTYDGVVAGAAPEPASWVLMIVGLGAAGAMVRRRTSVPAR